MYERKSTVSKFIKKLIDKKRKEDPSVQKDRHEVCYVKKHFILMDNATSDILASLNLTPDELQLISKVTLPCGFDLSTAVSCSKFGYQSCWVHGTSSVKGSRFFGKVEYIFYNKQTDELYCMVLKHTSIRRILSEVTDAFHELVFHPSLNSNLWIASTDDVVLECILAKDASVTVVYQKDPRIYFVPVLSYEHD